MDHIKLYLQWAFILTAFSVFGCSSLHVDVAPTTDWHTVSSVTLQEPEGDPWQLTEAIRTELQGMGFTVLDQESPRPTCESSSLSKKVRISMKRENSSLA